jgi:hypothetical protein
MLDIAIGISLVFALFAGLVSGVGEIIAQLLERRGKVLREGISSLVGELKESRAGSALVSSLYDHPLIKTLSQPGSQPSYIPASNFAAAFVQVLSGGSLATLRQKLDDRNSDLGKLFGPMLDEANGSIDAFKARVESQFDAVMDRVGGWYKRRSQAILAVIGLVLAVALNVDVLNILDRLDKDPKLASQLSEAAASAQADRIETLGVPIG